MFHKDKKGGFKRAALNTGHLDSPQKNQENINKRQTEHADSNGCIFFCLATLWTKMIEPSWDYPPLPFLKTIADTCPNALSLYLDLWSMRDKSHCVHLLKKEITQKTLFHTNQFMSTIRKISRLTSLISVIEGPSYIKIEFVSWDSE